MKNEINNPEYTDVVIALKKQLHIRLEQLGDRDPIATEKSLVKGKTATPKKRKKQKK